MNASASIRLVAYFDKSTERITDHGVTYFADGTMVVVEYSEAQPRTE